MSFVPRYTEQRSSRGRSSARRDLRSTAGAAPLRAAAARAATAGAAAPLARRAGASPIGPLRRARGRSHGRRARRLRARGSVARRGLDRTSAAQLKRRLYDAGRQAARAASCAGRASSGAGGAMALILDHVNGVADDNRLENLRDRLPATAPRRWTRTAAARTVRPLTPSACLRCGAAFRRPRAPAATARERAARARGTRRAAPTSGRRAGWSGRRMSELVAEVAADGLERGRAAGTA